MLIENKQSGIWPRLLQGTSPCHRTFWRRWDIKHVSLTVFLFYMYFPVKAPAPVSSKLKALERTWSFLLPRYVLVNETEDHKKTIENRKRFKHLREKPLKQKNNLPSFQRDVWLTRVFWRMVFPGYLFVSGDRCDFHSSSTN